MAHEARRLGLGVMVGNMVGTSLAMAPAFVLGQLCDVVDLDGPIFLAKDRTPSMTYVDGRAWSGEQVWGAGRGSCMSASQQTWFGQPRGLTILFLTEMWEIFSYYGMRALLVYYMTKQLLIGQEKASVIYGTYTAMAYFTPIFGGFIADRWLGKRRAVIIGGSIMAAGHFMMTFEPLFYAALATIALGNGLFLPSLPEPDRYALSGRGSAPRLGLQCLLRRHQYRRISGAVDLRHAGRILRLALGLRRRGRRHARGFDHLRSRRQVLARAGRELRPSTPVAPKEPPGSYRSTFLLLGAIVLAVTVFRGVYEQIGNTVALWADSGIDRTTAGMDAFR